MFKFRRRNIDNAKEVSTGDGSNESVIDGTQSSTVLSETSHVRSMTEEHVSMKTKTEEVLTDQPTPKFARPKILLLDMDAEVEEGLKKDGYNISVGSLGTPYKVPQSDGYKPLVSNHYLPPNYTEQDIVIVDLAPGKLLEQPPSERQVAPGEVDIYVVVLALFRLR